MGLNGVRASNKPITCFIRAAKVGSFGFITYIFLGFLQPFQANACKIHGFGDQHLHFSQTFLRRTLHLAPHRLGFQAPISKVQSIPQTQSR
jgi:hypothetical protein